MFHFGLHELTCTDSKMQHEDSAGNKGIVETGGVQWMCAGRGVIHAEMPLHAPGVPEPRGMQLWVDLPKQYKMVVCDEDKFCYNEFIK
jgi:quercetin 2,3-dioxygenase